MIDPRLLRLHADDNVLTVIRTLEPGDELQVEGMGVPITTRLPLGHKVAARAIGAGAKIVKYGAPIGSAKRAITPGEHVHTHNIQSDYIPTFARGEGAHYEHA
ncbi:MAG: UxaA family hydrolase [Chthoniobacteraceae bacterium]